MSAGGATLSTIAPPEGISLLGAPAGRPGIAGTAYDTAWLAAVPAEDAPAQPRFPAALQWLVEHQRADGSWGGAVRHQHDRLLCALAALVALARFVRRQPDHDASERGIRYLWQHGHLLSSEPAELVGFELLLPALIQQAQRAGIAVPPHLDVYGRQREEKLRLLPPEALYSPRATVVHSLEFLGDDVDPARLKAAQGDNGALGNSPATTAYYLARSNDRRAQTYLQECLGRHGGAMAPVLHPCETFELLWSAYHYFLVGVPSRRLLAPEEVAGLHDALDAGGVSLGLSFPIPDATDTAVALLLLHGLGSEVDPSVLRAFARPEGYFASFPHERHSSVGVNLHVLHALRGVPGYHEAERAIGRLVDYLLESQINRLYWIDKWHISPYYATAHAVRVLAELEATWLSRVRPAVERAGTGCGSPRTPTGRGGSTASRRLKRRPTPSSRSRRARPGASIHRTPSAARWQIATWPRLLAGARWRHTRPHRHCGSTSVSTPRRWSCARSSRLRATPTPRRSVCRAPARAARDLASGRYARVASARGPREEVRT